MAKRQIVTNGNHAVDAAQVSAVITTGCIDVRQWALEVFFVSGHTSAPMMFTSESDRDAFFKDLVSAMEG